MPQFLHKKKPAQEEAASAKCIGFEDVLVEHMESLWQVALRLTKYNQDDAKDHIQDAVLRAFKARESLSNVENCYAWLKRILVNTFLNSVRDNRKWNETQDLSAAEGIASDTFEGTPSLLIDAIKTDLWNDDLIHALESLPELTRQLFILSDIEGYTHEELSEMFSMPKGTISARIYRGRKKLAELLEEYAIQHGFIKREDVNKDRESMREAMALCQDRAKQEAEEFERMQTSEEKAQVKESVKL